MGRYVETMKRIFDIVVTVASAPLWLPLAVVVALMVRVKLGAPVLFRQTRPGRGGEPFQMVKFRSMTDERDQHGNLLPDADRLPPFGKLLRRTSLDELPGLYSVLKGDMSLVGPRPLLVQYLDRYTPRQARRHEVRPGMTGWAQVNGRNAASWDDRFEMDVWYVDNRSFGLDLRILALTVAKVFTGDGVTAEGEATVTEFMGSEPTKDRQKNGSSAAKPSASSAEDPLPKSEGRI